jgi:decaprenyl-phosphate phosphoribosyltransferase
MSVATENAAPSPLTDPAGVGATGHGPARLARSLVTLSRPGQWLKNPVVIALPLISAPAWTLGTAGQLVRSVLLFTLASIAVYTLNDLRDRERDRLHPSKRLRPLAAGTLAPSAARAYLAVLVLLLTGACALGQPGRDWPVYAYAVLNLAYSLWLKNIPLVDIFAVSMGFVLRAEQGYTAIGVSPSPLLLLAVFTVCLLMVLGKRRRELADGGIRHRPALRGYTVQLLDQLILICATLSTVAYLLLLRSDEDARHHPALVIVLTVPCALFALFRYLQLLVVGEGGGDPVRTLLGDRALLAVGAVWAGVVTIALAVFHLHL